MSQRTVDSSANGASRASWHYEATTTQPSPLRPPPPVPSDPNTESSAVNPMAGMNVSHVPRGGENGGPNHDRSAAFHGSSHALVPHNVSLLSSTRVSDVQHQLISLDREVAGLKEDAAIRAAECGMLKSALQREHETNLRLQAKHQHELEQLRSEYDKQTAHLMEQLAVLKSVSENAVADRKRVSDESNSRKVHLMQLLEREREEKSTIMADYRAQTEQLISEQGREISALRNLLEVARAEEEKLLHAAARNEEHLAELETKLIRSEAAVMDEKEAGARRLRDLESKHTGDTESLRRRHDESELDWNEAKQRLLRDLTSRDDQIRIATEKFEAYERDSENDRHQLRTHYEAAVERLSAEIKRVSDLKDATEATMRDEIDRLSKGDERLIASLRAEVDKARSERHAADADARQARETLVLEHQRRLQDVQEELSAAKLEASEERSGRKDAEAAKQSLTIRCEALQAANNRLTHELERTAVEHRARERQIEQDGLQQVEQLRAANRTVEGENARLRQSVKQLELDSQRHADDAMSVRSALETAKSDARIVEERLRSALDHATRQLEALRGTHQKTMDSMQSQRLQLETELQQVMRARDELEARHAAAQKQLTEERRALEDAISDGQAQKAIANEARIALDAEEVKLAAATSGCNERDALLARKQDTIGHLEAQLRDAQRDIHTARDEHNKTKHAAQRELDAVAVAHEQALADAKDALAVAQRESRMYKEAVLSSEAQVQELREDVDRLQREVIMREEQSSEADRTTRGQVDEEFRRLETVISSLRDELSRTQTQKIASQREVAEALHEGQRRVAIVQETLDLERQSKHRLQEELRSKEHIVAELTGNARMLSTRLQAKEEDIRRTEYELNEAATRLHDANSLISKKEAIVGQLMARLRVFESRNLTN